MPTPKIVGLAKTHPSGRTESIIFQAAPRCGTVTMVTYTNEGGVGEQFSAVSMTPSEAHKLANALRHNADLAERTGTTLPPVHPSNPGY